MDAESSNPSTSNSNHQDAQAPAEEPSSVHMKTSPSEMEMESITPQSPATNDMADTPTPANPSATAAGVPLAHPTPMSASSVLLHLARPRSAASNSSDSARSSSLPPSSQPNSPRQKITGFASIKQRLEAGGAFGSTPASSSGLHYPSGIPIQHETPAEPPPETPADLSETPRPIHPPNTPVPVRQIELPPRHSSEPPQSQHSDGERDELSFKREVMDAELTPQNSGLAHSQRASLPPTSQHLAKPRQTSVPLSTYEPPRRTTRGSIAAAAAAAHEQTLSPPKRTAPQPGEPVQASVNQWIITQDKNWVLPPPTLGVSLAQICPPDVEIKPWMKFTRHPILWDGMTDAGGKSGKKLVLIGAAAAKASVNGKLPARAPSHEEDPLEGLHLLMDYKSDEKPSYSYALMTRFAILGSPYKSLSLAEIYIMLEAKFPWFAREDNKWRDSIRYNLSSNNWFVKTKRALHQPGVGNLWTVDEESPGGPKRPRKGRNSKGGSAFTDIDDEEDDDHEGEEPAPSRPSATEQAPQAGTSRNGTLMLTFDSKQRVPLDTQQAERGASAHANHNLISRVSTRQQAPGAPPIRPPGPAQGPPESTTNSEVRPSKPAEQSNVPMDVARTERSISPKKTPAPPWMSSAEAEERDAGVGSGRDEESEESEGDDDQDWRDAYAAGIYGEVEDDQEMRNVSKEDLHMHDGSPRASKPQLSSFGQPQEKSSHSSSSSLDRTNPPMGPPQGLPPGPYGPTPTPQSPPIQERYVVKRRSFTLDDNGFKVAPPIKAPTFTDMINATETNEARPSTSQPPPPSTSKPSIPSFASVMGGPTNTTTPPPSRRIPAARAAGQRSSTPPFPSRGVRPNSFHGSSTISSPYAPPSESRKRKTMHPSPSGNRMTLDGRLPKSRRVGEDDDKQRRQNRINPMFSVDPSATSSSSGQGSSSRGAYGNQSSGSSMGPPPNPPLNSRGSDGKRRGYIGFTVPSGNKQFATPATADGNASFREYRSPPPTNSSFGQSNDMWKQGWNVISPINLGLPSKTGTGVPTSFTPFVKTTSSFGERKRRNSSGDDVDMDDEDGPVPNADQSSARQRRISASRMDVDDDSEEEEEERRGRSNFGHPLSQRPSQGNRPNMFGQAGTLLGSSLSVSVPISSSRMERGPPTPRDGMIMSPTVPSGTSSEFSSIFANNEPADRSSRLPPINTLLRASSPGIQSPLPAIQNVASLHQQQRHTSNSPHTPTPPSTAHRSNASTSSQQAPLPAPCNTTTSTEAPSTFGPPLYYGFIISSNPLPHSSPNSRYPYPGGDSDDLHAPSYRPRDWRD
ncbi:hypothetical protein CPB86DRAFT_557057 [Serendipita vermifera]|nr:hypothetical protein CPB86DRAFT_557057 [Serendipita vermifera]